MASLNLSPASFDFTLYRGDTFPLTINLKTAAGATYSLDGVYTDWTPTMNIETVDGVAVFNGNLTNSAATDGTKIAVTNISTLDLYLGSTTTKYLVPGVTYYYDIQVSNTILNPDQLVTLLKGTITVQGDITQ